MESVDIYVDGSFDGSLASWAFIVVENDNVTFKSKGVLTGEINEMRQVGGELEAVLRALDYCELIGKRANIFYDYIGIYKWVADFFSGEKAWRTNNKWTQSYRQQIQAKMRYINSFGKVEAHSGHKFNEMVDDFVRNGEVVERERVRLNSPIIGIAGVASSGKDSLYKAIVYIIAKNLISLKPARFALADKLKADLDDFCIRNYSISAFTSDKHKKDLIRPMMVAHGAVKRAISKGTYWTSLLQPEIEKATFGNYLPIITDIRYNEYPEDELFWLKKNNGKLIHISRIDERSNLIQPANKDEATNDPSLKESADLVITWPTFNNLQDRINFVEDKICQFLKNELKK